MKISIAILCAIALCGCAHRPKVVPATAELDQSIGKVSQSNQAAKQDIQAFKAGSDVVDYKAGRALQFFK